MAIVRVQIEDRDMKVGAMVKALAVEVAGLQSVKGTTNVSLRDHGYYDFTFPSESAAQKFESSVHKYLPHLASVLRTSD
jgi:hypothetical protein